MFIELLPWGTTVSRVWMKHLSLPHLDFDRGKSKLEAKKKIQSHTNTEIKVTLGRRTG